MTFPGRWWHEPDAQDGEDDLLSHRCIHVHPPSRFSRTLLIALRCFANNYFTAFRLTWVSLFFEIAAGIGGIVGYMVRLFVGSILDTLTGDFSCNHPRFCHINTQKTDSSLILAFGLENFVDLLSSLVVLWRFYCPHGFDEAKLAQLKKRELRADVSPRMSRSNVESPLSFLYCI